jgi:hypothetical protein
MPLCLSCKEQTENQGCQIFFPDTKSLVRFEPFKMVITSYLGRQVDPMLEVHTEQKVEFPLTEDFFYHRVNSCKASVLILALIFGWRGRIWVRHCCCFLVRCLGKEIKILFPCFVIFGAI